MEWSCDSGEKKFSGYYDCGSVAMTTTTHTGTCDPVPVLPTEPANTAAVR